ncbi:MAG TPA: tetratricopeptide repeat protein [Planctomycetaceae bacterium]|nr:tetratricopeptide repeat protein [Planctomycetaceae bacterium]
MGGTVEASAILSPLRIAFFGRLGGSTLKDARREVRRLGGTPVDAESNDLDWLVLGEAELPLAATEAQIETCLLERADRGDVRILSETEFWREIGRIDALPERQLYTAAALAALLDLPVSVIRRWHRSGLLQPVKSVHRLAYFDFSQAVTARQLARLLESGVSADALERKLEQLRRFVPAASRSLDQLGLMVDGGDILMRLDESWVDARGQRRFDFASSESPTVGSEAVPNGSSGGSGEQDEGHRAAPGATPTVEELIAQAEAFEDAGVLDAAVEWYRSALAAGGPTAPICFQLGEVLYRLGQLEAARERFYMALELDADFVEARANLGCVLAELEQYELARAAFVGALESHPDYGDVHHHLAATLEKLGQTEEARTHWERFLELSPRGPWADEVRERLSDKR